MDEERDKHAEFFYAEGSSAFWKYKVIYLYKDEQVGSWSDGISMTVSGQV